MSGSGYIKLDELREMKAQGRKFAMLTAYDYPTAVAAEAAGVHGLLIGDTMGAVLLGHGSTRKTPLELMLILGEAVRRGAPHVFLSGDLPYESLAGGDEAAVTGCKRFRDEAGCDAVKLEVEEEDAPLIEKVAQAGVVPIAHLGLRPQSVTSPDGYRAQARTEGEIAGLVRAVRTMERAGAQMILLEAVPPPASEAVVAAVGVPVIGCGAGPACDGHVLVTHDMLGIGNVRPPKFVPVHGDLGRQMQEAMQRYVDDIVMGRYPGPQHVYPMRAQISVSGESPTARQ